MVNNRNSLRQLLSTGEQVFAPCIWDCFSARATQLAGYRAALVSSAAVAYSITGLPDVGLLTSDEMVAITSRIAMASPLALIIDCEGGYGDTPLHAYRSVERLARAGASAVTMSDQCGMSGVERVVYKGGWDKDHWDSKLSCLSREDWLAKIRASVEAVKGTDCMVIARTESWYGFGLEEAITRCEMAAEIGADMSLICGITTLKECEEMNGRLPGWKMYPDVVSQNGVPDVELTDMKKNGFNLVTAHFLEKGAMWGMLDYSEHTIRDRNTLYIDGHDMNGRGVLHWFSQVPKFCDFDRWMSFEDNCFEKARKL